MQSSIYFAIVFVAITVAEQLNVGPQAFSEQQSSSSLPPSSQNLDKRYVTREYTLYLTPDEIQALQRINGFETEKNTQYPKENQPEQQSDEDEKQLQWYNSQFLPEAPQLEIRGIAAHDLFDQKLKSNSEIQQGNYNYINLYSEEKPKEQTKEIQRYPAISKENLENYFNWQKEQDNREELKVQRESGLQNDAKREPYLAVLTKNQDDIQLNEQLKQQWNRILDHKRIQLNSYSPVSQESQQLKQNEKSTVVFKNEDDIQLNEQLKQQWNRILDHNRVQLNSYSPVSQESQQLKQNEKSAVVTKNKDDIQLNEQLKQQWNRILDHNRVQLNSYSPVSKESQQLKQKEKSAEQWNSNDEIEKEIENILRDNRGFEKQYGNSKTGAINQRLPILIHKEVSVTKHLPVPFVKKVNVPVPTPVLVPVPEPYEVRIPHPYPVPQQVFKHIPLPVIRNQ